MTPLDWILIAIIVSSSLIGLWRGFSRELISLVAWVAAFYISLHFSGEVSQYFEKSVPNEQMRFIISVIAIFVVVVIVGYIFNKIVHAILRLTGFGLLDRFFGLIFGFVRAVLIGTMIFLVLQVTHYQNDEWTHQATLAPYFQPLVIYFEGWLPLEFKNARSAINDAAKRLVGMQHVFGA